jgi:hypothetical protein
MLTNNEESDTHMPMRVISTARIEATSDCVTQKNR